MKEARMLMTGDFWHSDFQSVLSSLQSPVTLVPIEKIGSVAESKFELIVIAQSHRDQIDNDDVEAIHGRFSGTPIVALQGSWCEGEMRSGSPFPGVTRVYWHQWQGRFDAFLEQWKDTDNPEGTTGWLAPRTATVGDRILASSGTSRDSMDSAIKDSVGISAWTASQHEMLADAIGHFGWSSHWIERETMDGALAQRMSLICVDADSWSPELNQRIQWIRKEISAAPMVLTLNYPREHELNDIRHAGVSEVVSKPFELNDLKSAICRALERQSPSNVETV